MRAAQREHPHGPGGQVTTLELALVYRRNGAGASSPSFLPPLPLSFPLSLPPRSHLRLPPGALDDELTSFLCGDRRCLMAPTTLMITSLRFARCSRTRPSSGTASAVTRRRSCRRLRLRSQTETMGAHLKETEAAHTAARMQWATKLEQAESEFKSDMMTREDLEKMRLTLIEETEAPWRARVKAMEAELAAAREAANAQRVEAERVRSQAEAAKIELRADASEATARHETVEAELRARLEMAESAALRAGAERGSHRRARCSVSTPRRLSARRGYSRRSRSCGATMTLPTRCPRPSARRRRSRARPRRRRVGRDREGSLPRISHLQHELDAACADERLHEASLQAETDKRLGAGRATRARARHPT